MKFFRYEKWGEKKFWIRDFYAFCSPHPVINDQSLIIQNFEGLDLLSPSELYKFMVSGK